MKSPPWPRVLDQGYVLCCNPSFSNSKPNLCPDTLALSKTPSCFSRYLIPGMAPSRLLYSALFCLAGAGRYPELQPSNSAPSASCIGIFPTSTFDVPDQWHTNKMAHLADADVVAAVTPCLMWQRDVALRLLIRRVAEIRQRDCGSCLLMMPYSWSARCSQVNMNEHMSVRRKLMCTIEGRAMMKHRRVPSLVGSGTSDLSASIADWIELLYPQIHHRHQVICPWTLYPWWSFSPFTISSLAILLSYKFSFALLKQS
jgi:hypothetical protein